MNIKDELEEIMKATFGLQELGIKEDMTASDIEDWDSLSHIQLIASVEQKFHIKFTMKEILRMKNVGDIITLIEEKIE